jgi:hypothetical protein
VIFLIERGYYHCPDCRVGLFPLDQQLELRDKHYSEGVLKEMVWVSGLVGSYEKAEEVLRRLGHFSVKE